MAGQKDITLEQGATYTASFTWKDANGAVVNLTGATAKLVVYSAQDIAATLNSPTEIVITPLQGKLDVTISAAATDLFLWIKGSWYLDVTLSGIVTRLVKGSVTVEPKKAA